MSRKTKYARFHEITDAELENLLREISRRQRLVLEMPADDPRYDRVFKRLLESERKFEYLFSLNYRRGLARMLKKRNIGFSII